MAGARDYSRLSHDDYEIGLFAKHVKLYGGGVSPLADPELLDAVKAALRAGYSLQRVAELSGYTMAIALQRAFKRATGTTLRAYARAQANRSR